ncbi:MAG TPA: hypothetical protein VNV41_16430 [Candidatus Acidoferrales bacterium]|jgi:hypothetical protein|nr:hypothetical protein [Candidatus Acidoferrales bacterium]
MLDDRLVNHPKLILLNAPLDDGARADLYDHFYDAKSSAELAQRLNGVNAPDEVKQQLFDAKKLSDAVVSPVDAVTAAISKITTIDPQVLELAESHPAVTKALLDSATKA